jgi:nitric oxide reductase large subunit
VLALAVVTTAQTPLTTDAGEWLYRRESHHSALLQTHAERGHWMIYVSVALLIVAIALALLHGLERRSQKKPRSATIIVAIVAVAVGLSSIAAVYQIGDSGARAVWHNKLARGARSPVAIGVG